MNGMPKDPIMLMSFVNMKLRDQYGSLDELCQDLDVDKTEVIAKLAEAGFEYSAENKRFW